MTLRRYSADLHIHSGLSPCADDDASPRAIVLRARQKGLDVIALTDHNSCENVARAVAEGTRAGVVVWPGMELQTREEVHLVCLFPGIAAALSFQDLVYGHLPARENSPERLGHQVVFGEDDEPVGECARLLLTSCDLSLSEAFTKVQEAGGLCLPAHVDRRAYSLVEVLGQIDPGLAFPGYEVSSEQATERIHRLCPWIPRGAVVVSSDAHRLEDIVSGRTILIMAEPTLTEFSSALSGRGEGRVVIR